MKKFALFLLLLGAGLLLLWWLDQESRPLVEQPPLAPTPPTSVPSPDEGVRFGGRTSWSQYDPITENLVWRLEMRDVRYADSVDTLLDVTLELFDRERANALQAHIEAENARVRRLPPPDGTPGRSPEPRWEMRLELENARARLVEGVPLAPIAFQAPNAILDATDPLDRTLVTEAVFSARSQELAIDGRGLDARLDQGLLELEHEGKVELRRATGKPARFEATGPGPVQVRRGANETDPVMLEAWDGTRLTLGEGTAGTLVARHVALRARKRAGDADELVVERLDADGEVDWDSGGVHLLGARLAADFDAAGNLSLARLEDNPRAELALQLGADTLPELGGADEVVLEGRDSLVMRAVEGGQEFVLDGLPSVTLEDFRLKSATRIEGFLAEDQASGRFTAEGGVVVEGGRATLETARFTLAFTNEGRATTLRGTAEGGARLSGSLERTPGDPRPARDFTLTTPETLVLERAVDGWRVVEGSEVELVLEGEDGFTARAERVFDVDLAAFTLRAGGEVAFENALGRLGGDELELLAIAPVPHFILRGSAATPAYFVDAHGQATAREFEVTGTTLEARGAVDGSASLAGEGAAQGEYTFHGDKLFLNYTEDELLPGERLRILRMRLEREQNPVSLTATAGGQTVVLASNSVASERRTRRVQGMPDVELGSLLIAEGAVHADVVTREGDFKLDCARVELERGPGTDEQGFRQLVADGDVRFQGLQDFDMAGECELFVLDGDKSGYLEAGPGARVFLRGNDPVSQKPYRLAAERVDFTLEKGRAARISARRPELRMLGLRSKSNTFAADPEQGVVLSGDVRVSGATKNQVPFTLDAERVVLVGRRGTEPLATTGEEDTLRSDQLDALTAEGSVAFQLGDSLHAHGERMVARRSEGLLRFEGAPVTFDFSAARLESDWIEYDWQLEVLAATGRGRLMSSPQVKPDGTTTEWEIDFLSASTLLELDSVVLVVQEPVFQTAQGQTALRSTWAILWLGRDAFSDKTKRDELLEGVKAAFDRMAALPGDAPIMKKLALLQTAEMAGLLREIYFEGPIEIVSEGELLARADAIYLDSKQQRGWLSGATVHLGGQFVGQRHEKLIIKTDWMRLSSDGTLRADSATVTPCTFDEPHVRVVTGDLRIEPLGTGGKENYRLLLKDNRIEFYDLFSLPLPTIDVATDEELKPVWRTLSLADSARFGTLLSFGFSRPADAVGAAVNKQLGNESTEVDANYKVDASYFGSRGGLLDFGLEVEGKDEYWLDLFFGVVVDSGEDRGFIRVDEDDRPLLRRWLRSQGYFKNGTSEWTFALSDQSDPAVMSEFFESQFLRYERAETYLQWHESDGVGFTQATAEVRLDSFRSEVEELPRVSTYRGRAPLASFGRFSLLHTGDLEAAWLRRREGEEPRSPFALPTVFPDGLGEREVLRIDTEQRLELPIPLGAGVKLTPFVSARGTSWDEGEDPDDSPTRTLAEAGASLGATFWKPSAHGKLHQLAPFVEYTNELHRDDSGGIPVVFDPIDRALSGDFLRLGLRQRYAADAEGSLLDVDLVGTHASSRSDGRPDGWMPLEVFARYVLEPFGHEIEVFHDGRYDVQNSRTAYSLVSFGTHFGAEWGLQFSHQRGLDENLKPLFEVASVTGLYRWTEKWEFEGRQSFSLLENQGLDTRFVIRRYGHDLVFELESSVREGEGSSIGINVKPRFGYSPSRVGYVPW